MLDVSDKAVLDLFHPLVREWFEVSFGAPSPPQRLVWPAISRGEHVLTVAPTGSGKTLAAFLMCMNVLLERVLSGEDLQGVQVIYISPLKALNNDIVRNLKGPLSEIRKLAEGKGIELPEISVEVRTGDTSAQRRTAMLKKPPHILVTTPETLYIMLTGPKSREILRSTKYVIIDEIHAICGGKRGVHLSLSLERLCELTESEPIRIGLSATQRPLERVAAYLGGFADNGQPRQVTICDAGMRKSMDLVLASPVPKWKGLPSGGVWDGITNQILELMESHRTVMVFVNARMSAERLTSRLNTTAGEQVAMCHHGSISREMREEAEDLLKRGELRCLVATSTMELGIDVGFVDLVVQVESPKSVSGGLQRVGRAGHLLHVTSKGRILPKTRVDMLECATISSLMSQGEIEETIIPDGCLDVLAQQVVAAVSVEDRTVDELLTTFKRSYCYRDLQREQMCRVLELLSGRGFAGPGRAFPRIVWDKVADRVSKTDGSRFLALRNAGTIPDRGNFTVYLGDGQVRLGELDEVFVYESRIGDTFVLGSSIYRIEEISGDKVTVGLSASHDARMPFWIGDMIGRPYRLSKEMGKLVRELVSYVQVGDRDGFMSFASTRCNCDTAMGDGLWDFIIDQLSSTGQFPDDQTIVIEYFSDEGGDKRGVIHGLFGNKVNYALSRLISRRILSTYFVEPECVRMDNGILYGMPKGFDIDLAAMLREVVSGDVESEVLAELRTTPIFSSIFRQCAIRSLIFSRPRRGRMPLWMQKLKSQPILEEAVTKGGRMHPLIQETLRECLQEVLDMESFLEVTRGIRLGTIRLVEARRTTPSPLAQNFDFNFTGLHMYNDPILGPGDEEDEDSAFGSRWVEEPLVVEDVARELNPLAMLGTGSREALQLAVDVSGEVAMEDARAQWGDQVEQWVSELQAAGLVAREWRGWREWIVDSSIIQMMPSASANTAEPIDIDTLVEVMRRPSSRWMPMTTAEIAERYAVLEVAALQALECLAQEGMLVRLPPTPAAPGQMRWCHPDIAEEISRRSLTFKRRSISPVDLTQAAAFALDWARLSACSLTPVEHSMDGLKEVLSQLQGLYFPIGTWEGVVLPLRLPSYRKEWLDELLTCGEVVWVTKPGTGALEGDGPEVGFYLEDDLHTLSPAFGGSFSSELTELEGKALDALSSRGASFVSGIGRQLGITSSDAQELMKSLLLKGLVSNDTLSPVRYWGKATKGKKIAVQTMMVGRWFTLSEVGVSPKTGDTTKLAVRSQTRRMISQLASRYGLLCRELADVCNEGWTMGQFEAELCRMEEGGLLRRGYIVNGLSGMQFSSIEAFQRLQTYKENTLGDASISNRGAVLLPLIDPSSYLLRVHLSKSGVALPKPATSYVVLIAGKPVLLAESSGSKLTRLAELSQQEMTQVIGALSGIGQFVRGMGGKGRVEVKTIDGVSILDHESVELFSSAGFTKGVNSMMQW